MFWNIWDRGWRAEYVNVASLERCGSIFKFENCFILIRSDGRKRFQRICICIAIPIKIYSWNLLWNRYIRRFLLFCHFWHYQRRLFLHVQKLTIVLYPKIILCNNMNVFVLFAVADECDFVVWIYIFAWKLHAVCTFLAGRRYIWRVGMMAIRCWTPKNRIVRRREICYPRLRHSLPNVILSIVLIWKRGVKSYSLFNRSCRGWKRK